MYKKFKYQYILIVNYNIKQKNKGASTHEISTGTPLTPAIISPPPLNSEQEGGEEDDE